MSLSPLSQSAEHCQELCYYPEFIPYAASRELCAELIASQTWPDNHYQVYGRQFQLPRLQTWHADPGIVYSYSNNLLVSREWLPQLQAIRELIRTKLGLSFNAVLMNYYRDGEDYVGWHADDDLEMGADPLIVSISLGATRNFSYRHNESSFEGALPLDSGSLVLMKPDFQHHWQHAVLADSRVTEPRINLTFRRLVPPLLS